ncbi:MAG TPA: D-amino-acid transaminase [Acidocella sp.]|nr:D-amino-acid transaminase [Acidocella sp.]
MGAVAYVNGRYRAQRHASIRIEDRGFQFGDGIYEVIYVHAGRLIDAELHLARLTRSLAAIALSAPLAPAALPMVIRSLLDRNRVTTGLVYLQVSRGVARRDHAFPADGTKPGLVITVKALLPPPRDAQAWAAAAICLPDERWARCDIKSTNLLPNVLARQQARAAGAYEAILLDAEGNVTEGAASTVWIVDSQGTLRTRALGPQILPGCTRAALAGLLAERQIGFEERPFSAATLRTAREIFVTSATSFIKPITRLDGAPVGNGAVGPLANQLFGWYMARLSGP